MANPRSSRGLLSKRQSARKYLPATLPHNCNNLIRQPSTVPKQHSPSISRSIARKGKHNNQPAGRRHAATPEPKLKVHFDTSTCALVQQHPEPCSQVHGKARHTKNSKEGNTACLPCRRRCAAMRAARQTS